MACGAGGNCCLPALDGPPSRGRFANCGGAQHFAGSPALDGPPSRGRFANCGGAQHFAGSPERSDSTR